MTAAQVPAWQPTDLPTLRAAYSDRTAALMAYLSSFAYSREIENRGIIAVPPELASLGFKGLRVFHNDLTDGWTYLAALHLIALTKMVLRLRRSENRAPRHRLVPSRLPRTRHCRTRQSPSPSSDIRRLRYAP